MNLTRGKILKEMIMINTELGTKGNNILQISPAKKDLHSLKMSLHHQNTHLYQLKETSEKLF